MEHGLTSNGLDVLGLIGVIILVGFFVGRVSRRLGIPQVVGFIVAGLLLGPSILHVVPQDLVENLDFVTELALGLIGFEMGLHLHFAALRKLGANIITIVIFQAAAPFVLVLGGVLLLTENLPLALLLGVLATATAPAATVDVLEEYEAEGPLTTSIVAVVGIDDALALIVFSLIVPLAESAYAPVAAPSLLEVLEVPLVEIGGSILVGALLGVPLAIYIKRYCDSATTQIAVTVGVIFLSAGLSNSLHLSEILTTMTLGAVVVNMSEGDASCIRETIEQAGPVLYILFFALVGARFEVLNVLLGTTTLVLAGAYMLLRIAGKFTGAWVGGYLSRAEPAVRDNIGLALLSQAGVAIGLALDIGDRFSAHGWPEQETWAMLTQGPSDVGLVLHFADEPNGAVLGALVVTIITATTFVVQLIGPILVKFAISRAGEMWRAGEFEGAAAD